MSSSQPSSHANDEPELSASLGTRSPPPMQQHQQQGSLLSRIALMHSSSTVRQHHSSQSTAHSTQHIHASPPDQEATAEIIQSQSDRTVQASVTAPALAPPPTTLTSSEADLQMVADLKSELFHASRQLTLARQQARTSEESCEELRRRCQGLEIDRQAVTVQMQDAETRLQARQRRLEEHRRDGAEAALKVVSLTAERDELTSQVQAAWDRVADLTAALRGREAEVHQLQRELVDSQHTQELLRSQYGSLEQQLLSVKEQLRESGADLNVQGHARQRLTAALQDAVQRLAGLLSDVAFDYQRSLEAEREEGSGAREAEVTDTVLRQRSRITAEGSDTAAAAAAASSDVVHEGGAGRDAPHVVLSPAYRSFSAPSHPPAGASTASAVEEEALRLRAEYLLQDAEAAVLGELWATLGDHGGAAAEAAASTTHTSTSAKGDDNPSSIFAKQQQSPGRVANGAATPLQWRSPDASQPGMAHSQSLHSPAESNAVQLRSRSSFTSLSDEAVLRAALAPLLLAMKHLAALLGSVRHDRRRSVAEATHAHDRSHRLQAQLEEAQRLLSTQVGESETIRGQLVAMRQRAERAEAALLVHQREDTQRRTTLAHTLECREDWALIQHSVERLLLHQRELQKDMVHWRRVPRDVGLNGSTVSAVEGSPQEIPRNAFWLDARDTKQRQQTEREQTRSVPAFSAQPSSAAAAAVRSAPDSSEKGEESVDRLSPTSRRAVLTAPPAMIDSPTSPPPSHVDADAAAATSEQSRSPSAWLHRSSMTPVLSPESDQGRASADGKRAAGVVEEATTVATRNSAAAHAVMVTVSAAPRPPHAAKAIPAQVPEESPSSTSSSSSSTGSSSSTSASSLQHTSAYEGGRSSFQRQKTGDGRAAMTAIAAPLQQPPRSWRYPAPLPEKGLHAPSSLSATERTLLASLHNTTASSPASAAGGDVSPLPSAPVMTGHNTHEDGYDGIDSSSLFAAEVLQVIEALDRRVSGALHRAPRV